MLYTPQQRRRCNTAKLDNQTSLLPLSTCLCLVRFRTRAFASGGAMRAAGDARRGPHKDCSNITAFR